MQVRSGVKGLHWVIKLKPLLGAYQCQETFTLSTSLSHHAPHNLVLNSPFARTNSYFYSSTGMKGTEVPTLGAAVHALECQTLGAAVHACDCTCVLTRSRSLSRDSLAMRIVLFLPMQSSLTSF